VRKNEQRDLVEQQKDAVAAEAETADGRFGFWKPFSDRLREKIAEKFDWLSLLSPASPTQNRTHVVVITLRRRRVPDDRLSRQI